MSTEKDNTTTANAYQAKRAARVERLRAAAERAAQESDRAHQAARDIGRHIPFGQPILVGHHSEKRHRRDLARIDANMQKSIEAQKRAEELAYRAAAAEANTAISSDDPDAIEALTAQLAELEATRERFKAINATIRKHKTDEARITAIVAGGLANERQAAELVKPDFCGRTGIPDYAMANHGANIRRVKQRIERLQSVAALDYQTLTICGVTLEGPIDNRLRVHFPGKPSPEVIADLKRSGFRWAPSEGAWQRMYSNQAIYHAKRIAEGGLQS